MGIIWSDPLINGILYYILLGRISLQLATRKISKKMIMVFQNMFVFMMGITCNKTLFCLLVLTCILCLQFTKVNKTELHYK